MSSFENYSKYYDLFYKNKNYKKEVDYVEDLLKKYSDRPIETLLDIGCGTGIHARIFAEKNYRVIGFDLSEKMIKIAKQRKADNLEFHVLDATDFDLKQKFDGVVSLFHVASYQATNEMLKKFIANAVKHLNKGGVFLFDCWYGPAVLTDRPVVRVKQIENDTVKIIRIAEPEMFPNENKVHVDYEIIIEDKQTKIVDKIYETHIMRYLFKPEIELLLKKYNLELVYCAEWLTGQEASFDSWNVSFIGKKQ